MTEQKYPPADQFPTDIKVAAVYMSMPAPDDYSVKLKWANIRDELPRHFKKPSLDLLLNFLTNILTDSSESTERAIDATLIDLRSEAPVEWELDRRYKNIHNDGSYIYRLMSLHLVINPNGAFAIMNTNKEILLEQKSKGGRTFTFPPHLYFRT
ncbi:hypothetical protein FSY45_20440 [Comamonas sp. Z1]|uniref:hypothetical protein n=1 Tax=Comamonas sp. Z1 TaxID=2601246 RepID=UPI0011E669B3|nr:hypothetical protein [Comamonas sp. Z1]TYK74205.1 hypothetical protein FSY45_20440 [Comamonas sp. Z1]